MKNSIFYKTCNKIPKQIFIWNDAETRAFSLQTTLRWNNVDKYTTDKDSIPIKKKRWEPIDQSVEGLIKQWGTVPDWTQLPIYFPFQMASSWPLPWQLLFRSLIFSACYPQQSMLLIRPWNGWCWIYRWIQWCTKNLGKIKTVHIYPECTSDDPIRENHENIGMDIGWYLLEHFSKNKNKPQFQALREIHQTLFVKNKQVSEMSYLFMDFVTNVTLSNRDKDMKLLPNYEEDVLLYINLPRVWHTIAGQDRSSEDLISEFKKIINEINVQPKPPREKKEKTTEKEAESGNETIMDWYVPQCRIDRETLPQSMEPDVCGGQNYYKNIETGTFAERGASCGAMSE